MVPNNYPDRKPAPKGKLLYLFSGPDRQSEGLDAFAALLGFEVEMWDTVRDKGLDLVDERNLQSIISRIEANEFAAVFISPPCSTFCRAME